MHERMTTYYYVTLGKLDHNHQVSVISSTQYKIVLSRDLIGWITTEGRSPRSFTNFITTPELSGPFHISPDIFIIPKSQIFTFTADSSLCIKHLPNCYSVRSSRVYPNFYSLE
jgi:hypothetical protein